MPDAQERYRTLQEMAAKVHGHLRVVFVEDDHIEDGKSYLIRAVQYDPMDLDAGLTYFENYLASPKAAQRAELLTKRDEALAALKAARRDWLAATFAVEDNDKELPPELVMTAGELRAAFAAVKQDKLVRGFLKKIKALPDDAEVVITSDDPLPPGIGVKFEPKD